MMAMYHTCIWVTQCCIPFAASQDKHDSLDFYAMRTSSTHEWKLVIYVYMVQPVRTCVHTAQRQLDIYQCKVNG